MKTITFKQAYNLLDSCSAVVWANCCRAVTYPCMFDEEMEDEGEDCFMELFYVDEEGTEYQSRFFRKDNNRVEVDSDNNCLVLTDDTGEKQELLLLTPLNLSEVNFI